jgi:hypothetical protein
VDVHTYVFADDWSQFLEIQEGLLFGIMQIVQEAGAAIAIPSQITYLAAHPRGDATAAVGAQDLPGRLPTHGS